MKLITTTILAIIAFTSYSQEMCELAFISDHIIVNQTEDTLHVYVDNKNQESFPTKGPTLVVVLPNSEVKVSDLNILSLIKDQDKLPLYLTIMMRWKPHSIERDQEAVLESLMRIKKE